MGVGWLAWPNSYFLVPEVGGNMSTRAAERDYAGARTQRRTAEWAETKPSFMTTEFYAMIAAIVGTIIAGESNGSWDDRWYGRLWLRSRLATWSAVDLPSLARLIAATTI